MNAPWRFVLQIVFFDRIPKEKNVGTKKPKQMFLARVDPVVKALIRAERAIGESDGVFIERLVIESITTKRGLEIIQKYAQRDIVLMAALRKIR